MWHLGVCDVVDGYLPPELCNVIFGCLAVSCDGDLNDDERSSFDDF